MPDVIDFTERLQRLQKELTERVSKIEADLRHPDQPLSADFEEQATEVETEEVLLALKVEAEEELAMIADALTRLELGQYGKCTSCGDDIEANRLKAVPFAPHCMRCQQAAES